MKQEQEAAGTGASEVGPDVVRMQLPIQMPGLGHVNMYALVDERGAAIVDPGLPGPFTWRAILDRLGKAGLKVADVHTVLVTHSHPDHFGSAGHLAKEAGAELITHSAFRTFWNNGPKQHDCADDVVHDVDPADLESGNPFETQTPWGGQRFKPPLARRLRFQLMRRVGKAFVPNPSRKLRDGEAIKLAGREWTAVHTPGHTIDHLCLFDPEHGLLLSGDHVLPTITPHISGLGSGRDPLKAFYASLDKVASLPGVRRVLPAHGHPFDDLGDRVDHIKKHHDERLATLVASLSRHGRASVIDLSHELFRPARWGSMAESETYAHLEHLRLSGQATAHQEDGLLLYELTGGGRPDPSPQQEA